jgi:hypothetical protein
LVVPSLPPKRGRPKKTVTSVGNAWCDPKSRGGYVEATCVNSRAGMIKNMLNN